MGLHKRWAYTRGGLTQEVGLLATCGGGGDMVRWKVDVFNDVFKSYSYYFINIARNIAPCHKHIIKFFSMMS